INDMDRGMDPETIQVISRSSTAKDIYLKIIESAENEVMLLFPTGTSLKRQEKIGIIGTLEKAIMERNVKVKILLPKDKQIEEILQNFKENCKEHDLLVNVRYIEQMQDTKATILIADRNVSLVMELKDDSKPTFFEAIGLSTYSNSKAGILSYISIFENLWKITELLEDLSSANQKLQKQEKLQREFIHIAAHEFRNPIQPILALSQVIKNYTNKYYKEQNELLDIIYRNSKRLERLSEDILDISRIESNNLQLKKEKLNLNEFLHQVVIDYRQSLEKLSNVFEEKKNAINIKFFALSDNVLIVEWDKERLNQVICNLLDNAYRFAKENNEEGKGKIIITCDRDTTEYAIVRVKDNGPGIDYEILPKIFTKFASKSKNGTGLGLFICKNIIESYDGRIWIEDNKGNIDKKNKNDSKYDPKTKADNKGTTIAFSIPIVESYSIQKESASNNHFSKSNSFGQNNDIAKNILIIDDENDLAITYKIGLESAGFIVDTYNDPLEALSRFIPNYYDLLLIDIRMPKMDGYELFDKIRGKDEKAKACFITAYDIDSSNLEMIYSSSKENENKCIIKKPIEIDKLIDFIKEKIR
ncbi:MAG: hybrid sensor histidine kinase/response regulator, partial [Thermoproteota archaeon]|nr:hybrid sensor histidine kinase/response regulator [Thermoproteota archaeon]